MKRTTILILILVLVAALLVIVAIQPSQVKNKPVLVTPKLQPTPVADSTLYISPNPIQMATDSAQAEVFINSGRNSVTAVQLEIAYDPNILTNFTIQPGNFLPSPMVLLNKIDQKNGRITLALGLAPAAEPVKGTGLVATISFERNLETNIATVTPVSSTNITILDKSLATMLGVSGSVLKNMHGATVIFPLK
jgi:hypothetical protein